MCGIFGYIGHNSDSEVSVKMLQMMASANVSRGADSHGVTQMIGDKIVTFKSPGSFDDNLDALNWCQGAKVVIGHTRFSTSGTWEVNKNNQPLFWGYQVWKLEDKEVELPPMAMVHNGTLNNYDKLVREWDCRSQLKTECDSEIIGYMVRMYLAVGNSMPDAIKKACDNLRSYKSGPTPNLALLFIYKNKLWTYRDGNPTYWYKGDSGLYFSSIKFDDRYDGEFGAQPTEKAFGYGIPKDNRKAEDLPQPNQQPLAYARSRNRKSTTKVLEHGKRVYRSQVETMRDYPIIGDDIYVTANGQNEYFNSEWHYIQEAVN